MCIWLFYILFSNKIYLFIYFLFFLLLQFGVGTFYGKCRNAGDENPREALDSWIAPQSAADSDLEVEEEPDSDIDDPSFFPDDSILEDEDLHEPSTSSGVSSKRG